MHFKIEACISMNCVNMKILTFLCVVKTDFHKYILLWKCLILCDRTKKEDLWFPMGHGATFDANDFCLSKVITDWNLKWKRKQGRQKFHSRYSIDETFKIYQKRKDITLSRKMWKKTFKNIFSPTFW